jgi:hypothetical protein
MGTDARSQAILAEIAGLSQAAPTAPQQPIPPAEGESPAASAYFQKVGIEKPTVNTPTDRNAAILSEVEGLAKALPVSHEQAVLSEQEALIARRSQPVISGGSFLEKSLDILNSPQQAIFGVVTREEGESVWDGAIRGMKENERFLDVLQREFDYDPASFANRAVGFAGDVLLDPLILIAGPLFRGASKGLKLTGKLGIGAAKTVAPNLSRKLFESAILPTARAFSKTAFRGEAEKDLLTLIDFEIGKAQLKSQRILLEENEARKIAIDLAKKLDLPEESVLSEVARRVEVKTKAQLAFPFRDLKMTEKAVAAKQLDLISGELGRDFSAIEETLKAASDDLAGSLNLPNTEAREIALQATSLKQRLENALLRERSFGLKTTRLDDSTVDYLTHLTTPEAKKALLDLPQFRSFGREFNPRHSFQLMRQLTEEHPAIAKVIEEGGSANIQTLNRLWQEGKLFPQLGPQTSKLFSDDPFLTSAVRRVRGEKAITDAEVLIKASGDRRFALPKGEAPAHYRPLNLPSDARFDRLRNYTAHFRYPPEIAEHLEKTVETTLLPEGLDKFLKTFDTLQNIWKQLTLSPFPAYHLRNMVGNLWNNCLAGLNNPKYYSQAFRLQLVPREIKKIARILPHAQETGVLPTPTAPLLKAAQVIGEIAASEARLPVFKLAGKEYKAEMLLQMAEDFGITTGTFVRGEVFRKGMPGMAGRVYFTAEEIPGLGKVITKGMEAGHMIESNARLAHFLWKLDQGATPAEAALSVKKYLFDYSRGLTGFEQRVMRRVFPFYAWTRFNIPLQIESLVINPRPYVRLSEIVNTMRTRGEQAIPTSFAEFGREAPSPEFERKAAEYRGQDQIYLASWIKDSVGIPYRIGPSGEPEYFLLSGWLPAGDVNALGAGGFYDRLRNLLSPFLRVPIEQLTNYDLFRLEQIEKYPGETSRFMGLEVRKRNIQMVKNIRLLAEADRVMKFWQKTEDLTDPELSALGATTRFLFGLKSYEAKPHIEATKLRHKRTERLRQLKSAVRRELPGAVEVLRGELMGEEGEEE